MKIEGFFLLRRWIESLLPEYRILNTKRSKRWDGKIETLAADYLKDVITQMTAYGERVQFALNGPGQRPNYQVINSFDKKMAFDGNNHLRHPQEGEFAGSNASRVLTLEQINAAMAGVGVKKTVAARTTRASTRSSAATVKAGDLIDIQKYEYFKNNVQKLPEGIRAYSQNVTELMKKGLSAEAAFGQIVQEYF